MGWAWNVKASRYYNTETGHFMARSQVMAMAEESLVATTSATDTLATYVAEGMVSPADWRLLMREEIKREYIREYVAGRGGRNVMTQADWGSVGGMLRDQYRYLDGFAAEVAGLSEAQIRMRASMYVNSAREGFERAQGRVATGAGFMEAFWSVNHAAENCEDCLMLEGMSPQPAPEGGGFPGPDAIHYPGDGNTQCMCITSPESQVLTSQGWLPLLDVRVGDSVFTHRNRWRRVTGLLVKPAAAYHRQAWLIGPGGRRVGCTDNHPWYTEHGWHNAADIRGSGVLCHHIGRGAADHEDMSGVWYRFAEAEQAQQVHVLSLGVSLRDVQGSPGGGVPILRHEQESQGAMGQSRITGHDRSGNQAGWQEAPNPVGRLGPIDLAGKIRWPLLELVLARRAQSQEHHIPLSVGVDYGQWADPPGPCGASHQPGRSRRSVGESTIAFGPRTLQAAWQDCQLKEQEAVVDLPGVRRAVSAVSPGRCRPEVLLGGVLPRGAAVYDLTVEEDHSFVIEGFVAHNTNCKCGIDYRNAEGVSFTAE